MAATEREILRSELRWSGVAIAAILLLLSCTLYATMALHRNPPSNIEHVDPATLHLAGEFTEANLGTRVAADGPSPPASSPRSSRSCRAASRAAETSR